MNTLSLISKHRTGLMGIAILLILIYHSGLDRYIHFEPVRYFFAKGYGGVDIFLLLSGFGLYYSSLKKESAIAFYKKRLLRIMPAYIVVLCLYYFVFNDYNVIDWILNVLGISFWIDQSGFEWFIPSLLFLYLIYPVFSYFFDKYSILTVLVVSLLSIFIVVLMSIYGDNYIDMRKMCISRIPVFCLGVLFGKFSLSLKKDYKGVKWFFVLMILPAYFILYECEIRYVIYLWWGVFWLPFFFIAPGLSFVFADLLNRIPDRSVIVKILNFLGGITLEIYLVHLLLEPIRVDLIGTEKYNFVLLNLVYFILSILFAYILSFCVKKSLLCMKNMKRPQVGKLDKR